MGPRRGRVTRTVGGEDGEGGVQESSGRWVGRWGGRERGKEVDGCIYTLGTILLVLETSLKEI